MSEIANFANNISKIIMMKRTMAVRQISMWGVPDDAHKLVFNNVYLDDNLDVDTNFPGYYGDYSGVPVQHKMTVIGIVCSGELDMRFNLRNYHFGPGQVVVIPEGAIVDRVSHQGQLHFAIIAINNQGNDYLSGIRKCLTVPIYLFCACRLAL